MRWGWGERGARRGGGLVGVEGGGGDGGELGLWIIHGM